MQFCPSVAFGSPLFPYRAISVWARGKTAFFETIVDDPQVDGEGPFFSPRRFVFAPTAACFVLDIDLVAPSPP